MLGFEVSESTVSRYMIETCGPRSQGWKTFLRNHAAGIAAIDLFVGPDYLVQVALWSGDSAARPKAADPDRSHRQSVG